MADFNWIIDVLDKIHEFSQDNDLQEIGAKASLAKMVAAKEITKRSTPERKTDRDTHSQSANHKTPLRTRTSSGASERLESLFDLSALRTIKKT